MTPHETRHEADARRRRTARAAGYYQLAEPARQIDLTTRPANAELID